MAVAPIAGLIGYLIKKGPDLLLKLEYLLRAFLAIVCRGLYWLIAAIFDLFINLSKVRLLSSDGTIKAIYGRITIILTIIMTFYIIFELVKYLLEPDTITDKEKGAGKVALKLVVVIALIAFVPTIFDLAYKLQNSILETNVIGQVILGKARKDTSASGKIFAADMFSKFYYYDEDFWTEKQIVPDCGGIDCKTIINQNISDLATTGYMTNITFGLEHKEKVVTGGIQTAESGISFRGFLAILVGGFVLYVLLLYCIDIGTRVAQLAFLQVIAPIPIIGYLAPQKDNIFDKWVKQCLTTYVDLFLRLAIIYLILMIEEIIGDAYRNNQLVTNVNPDMAFFIYVALILGLLAFAQRVPKLLEEIFPKIGVAGGNFSLKPGERVRTAGRVLGGVIGASTGFVRGTFNRSGFGGFRGISGAIQGAIQGSSKDGNMFSNIAKANKNLSDKINRDQDIKHDGGSIFKSRFFPLSEQAAAKRFERKSADYESVKKDKDAVTGSADEVKSVKQLKAAWESAKNGGASKDEINDAYKAYKAEQKKILHAARQIDKAEWKTRTNANGTTEGYYEIVRTDAQGNPLLDANGNPITVELSTEDYMRAKETKGQLDKMKKDMQSNHLYDELTIEVPDEQGNLTTKRVRDLSDEEFIENMGEIATAAETARSAFERRKRTTEAKADARATGGR